MCKIITAINNNLRIKMIIVSSILLIPCFNLRAQNNKTFHVNYLEEQKLIKEKLCRKWFLVQVIIPNYDKVIDSFSDGYTLDTLNYNDTISESLILLSSNEYIITSKVDLIDKNNPHNIIENGNWVLKDNLSALFFNCNYKNADTVSFCSGWKIIVLNKTTLIIRFQTRGGSITKKYK